MTEEEDFVERPPRLPVDLPATIVLPEGRAVEAVITNLSGSGFSARCGERILIGTEVKICASEIGERDASIRWALGPRLGGKFV